MRSKRHRNKINKYGIHNYELADQAANIRWREVIIPAVEDKVFDAPRDLGLQGCT